LTELARWGMETLPPRTENRPFRAHWLVLALRARFDASAAVGVSESYEFSIPGHRLVRLDGAGGLGLPSLGAAVRPAVRVSGAGRHHLPGALAGAVPQLWNSGGNEPRDRACLFHAALDLDERSQELMAERAAHELFGRGRRGEACLHPDSGAPRGAHDPRPA